MRAEGTVAPRYARVVGACRLVASVEFTLAVAFETASLAKYDSVRATLSDLGNSSLVGSHALIFNVAVFVCGALGLLSALLLVDFLPRVGGWSIGLVLLALGGIGAMGVGLVPENVDRGVHLAFAYTSFFTGGLATLLLADPCARLVQRDWLADLMVACGVLNLIALFAFVAGIGAVRYGGLLERAIVGPVLLWSAVFGVLLLVQRRWPNPAVPPLALGPHVAGPGEGAPPSP